MPLNSKGAGASRADPHRAAIRHGRSSQNSEFIQKFHSVSARQAAHIRDRVGISTSLANVIAGHAYGEVDDAEDHWISLGDALAMAIDTATKAYEAQS